VAIGAAVGNFNGTGVGTSVHVDEHRREL
jgi:hypothetical protein